MFKLNENIIYYSYYLKDLKTEELVVEEIVDNDFEFEQAIPLLTTPCYASCSLINDTNKSQNILNPSIIIILLTYRNLTNLDFF